MLHAPHLSLETKAWHLDSVFPEWLAENSVVLLRDATNKISQPIHRIRCFCDTSTVTVDL